MVLCNKIHVFSKTADICETRSGCSYTHSKVSLKRLRRILSRMALRRLMSSELFKQLIGNWIYCIPGCFSLFHANL